MPPVMTILLVILTAAAAVLCFVYPNTAKKKAAALTERHSDRIQGCELINAAVLDVKNKAVILQFRIEEQKRTVITRCTEYASGNYSRGDNVQIYFREENPVDFVLIKGDNPDEYAVQRLYSFVKPAYIAGGLSAAASAVLLLLIFL